MIKKTKALFVKGVRVFVFCLLFSGCVISPEDESIESAKAEGFPQKVRDVFLSSGMPSFDAPTEVVGLIFDSGSSDYTSSANTFLLSYAGAEQKDFDDYANYLVTILGNYADVSQANYSCYGWLKNGTGIELGFSNESVPVLDIMGLSISVIPPYTLYLLIGVY
jgi:hypothetical protein